MPVNAHSAEIILEYNDKKHGAHKRDERKHSKRKRELETEREEEWCLEQEPECVSYLFHHNLKEYNCCGDVEAAADWAESEVL